MRSRHHSTEAGPRANASTIASSPRDNANLLHDLGQALAAMPLASTTVDLTAIVEVVLGVLGPEASPSTQLNVAWPNEPLEIEANRSAVPLALFHVCLNAVQAANAVPAGEVRISFRRSLSGGVLVDVADNGPGMDPTTLRRAFDPLFTKGKDGSATGVGLSLARALLRAIGGDVTLESTPKRGTIAHIALGGAS